MSKADPYEHYEPEMFDGEILTTETMMNHCFAEMKKIKNKKLITAKAKEVKMEPLVEMIKEGKQKILQLLMRKN